MKLILSFLVFLLCFFSSFAQSTITLKGKILKNKTQSAIESATVYLIRPKDSSVVEYTISDKNGLFKLEINKIAENVLLKISGEGYEDFSQKIEKINASKDFGMLYLTEKINVLNEVVVKTMAPPVRVKKDTLEFNAAAFKLRPDANVEALLKQLPGVVIDADKKITVNGKEVNQILVNGKSFFGEDGKEVLQNLPAELIKKVQVSDTKTKEEEFTKQAASSNNASINLTIEKDKNKGFFGKFLAGYGTSERYESSALMSYFKDKRRISFLASSNNINATGFSMDEVFDNMGGGRNYGSRAPKASGIGIIKSNLIGLNYADEWFKGFKPNGNYFFNNLESENKNKTTTLTLLPIGSNLTKSNSDTNKESSEHNLDFNVEYEISPKTKLLVRPKLISGITKSRTNNEDKTWNDANELINESNGSNTDETDKTNFQNDISFFKAMKKKGRYFTTNFRNENSKSDSNAFVDLATLFLQDPDKNVIRNQNTKSVSYKDRYSNSIRYSEPITDSLTINLLLITDWEKLKEDKKTFDFNATTNSFSDLNELYSNYITSTKLEISPKAGFSINKKKFNLSVSTGTYMISTDNYSLYTKTATNLTKNYIIPEGTVQGSYRFSKTKGLFLFYDRRFSIPKGYQVLPVDNIENPLNKITGNPDLTAAKSHYLNFNFSNYDYKLRSGYSLSSNVNYNDSQIVTNSIFDNNGRQLTTFTNISGTYTTSLGANWEKTFKKEANTFGVNLGLNTNYNLNKGFTNFQLYEANTLAFSLNLTLSYDYGQLINIKPSYNYSSSNTTFTNISVESASNTFHNLKIEMTNKWPKNWVFGNDFGYSYNSTISPGFKKDFYLWNTSLSYQFAKDKMSFKVKVYDMLNQNQSATRNVTPTTVVDAENTVLKRYAMFSLSYKFQEFAVKKK